MPAGPGRDGQEGFCAIPAEWHGLNVLEESCFLSGAVCQPHQQLRDLHWRVPTSFRLGTPLRAFGTEEE